jgi:hypothetical protein
MRIKKAAHGERAGGGERDGKNRNRENGFI